MCEIHRWCEKWRILLYRWNWSHIRETCKKGNISYLPGSLAYKYFKAGLYFNPVIYYLFSLFIRSVIQDYSQVADKLQIHPVPSAFQIRFGGCKGMVAQDPTLGNDTDILVIRKSMKKFESKSNNLEILDVTGPGKKYRCVYCF